MENVEGLHRAAGGEVSVTTSTEETAQVLNISVETVMRDWKMAKVWLLREMGTGESDGT